MGLLSGYSLKAESLGAGCVTDFVSLGIENTSASSAEYFCAYWLQAGPDTWHHYVGFERSAALS